VCGVGGGGAEVWGGGVGGEVSECGAWGVNYTHIKVIVSFG